MLREFIRRVAQLVASDTGSVHMNTRDGNLVRVPVSLSDLPKQGEVELKSFEIYFDPSGDGDDLKGYIIAQVLRAVDNQEGGYFTVVSPPQPVGINNHPSLWFTVHTRSGDSFSISLTVSAELYEDGSIKLWLIFFDVFRWRTPESEEVVGQTMFCIERALASLPKSSRGPEWVQTVGDWKHGTRFP